MAEPPRRFPTPWHADPMPGGYVVPDANGQALGYLDGRDNDAEARQAKVLTNRFLRLCGGIKIRCLTTWPRPIRLEERRCRAVGLDGNT
jgi:hypothetical protein